MLVYLTYTLIHTYTHSPEKVPTCANSHTAIPCVSTRVYTKFWKWTPRGPFFFFKKTAPGISASYFLLIPMLVPVGTGCRSPRGKLVPMVWVIFQEVVPTRVQKRTHTHTHTPTVPTVTLNWTSHHSSLYHFLSGSNPHPHTVFYLTHLLHVYSLFTLVYCNLELVCHCNFVILWLYFAIVE